MAESVAEERSVGGYVSCIKINGKPILPPMMTPERWVEMKRYKEKAIVIEESLKMKRNSVDSGVICPLSRSSSLANRKPVDIAETTSSNIHSSASDEEALFCEIERQCMSLIAVHDDKKMSTVLNNANLCGRENIQESHFILRCLSPVDMNVSVVHRVTRQDNNITQNIDKINPMPAEISETIPPPKGNIHKVSLVRSKSENLLHQSTMEIQEQNLQSGAKDVSPRITESVLPSTCPQNTVNFGTISPDHVPVNQVTSPIAESLTSTKHSSHSGDEARVPVKKVHTSLNISEIIAQDDIIQDSLGFKVWKHGCEVLNRRSQHVSTPADTIEENLSNIETNRIENLDESESSIVATASTDLNNYMNTSDSSKSPASIQSLSSIAPAVHESEIAKQTTHDHHQSSLSDQSKDLQGETQAHRSFNKSIPESQMKNSADNFDIDGIGPLDSGSKVGQPSASGVGVIKRSTAGEVETVKKLEDHVKENTAESIESNESRTSSNSPPPRLKRQNSYVLECPSPLLVEYYKSLKHDGDMTASPTKKKLSTVENQQEVQRHRLSGSQFNSSLPSSSVSSPIKLQSPFASSECLSSRKENTSTSNIAMSKHMIRKSCLPSKDNLRKSRCISSETARRVSADETHLRGKKSVQKIPLAYSPRYGSVENTSIGFSRKSTTAIKCPKTPRKTPSISSTSLQNITPRNSVKHVACASQYHSTESLVQRPTPSGTPEKVSAQEELRAVFLQLQIEHQQQMADLLKKQEREQEAMREAFRQQQIKLMTEIRSICPEVFSTPESHKLLAKSVTQPLNINVTVGLKGVDHDKKSCNNSALENVTEDLQESTRQKQTNPNVDKNFVNKKMKNDDSSGSQYWDEVSFSEAQSINTSTSEAAEILISSNINPSQEACQNQKNSPLASGHMDLCNIDSSVHKNNAAQHTKENVAQQLQNIHNSTTSPNTEAIARENMNFLSEVSSNKSDLSRSVTTESSVSVEHSDSIVTSGASGNKIPQQMLYAVHTNGAVISKMSHLDEISLSRVQSISTNSSDVTEISKQVYRRKPSLSGTTDDVMVADAALTSVVSDLDENTAMQQALYGLQTDGKIVSSMLTVAKSEVILSDGLPYHEPREETVRTTVFTQLNGVDHNSLVNTHISTVMQGARQSCSRELFPARSRFGANYTKTHERAAVRIQCVIRGYLTRRLFRTSRVQDLITTIRDTLLCAVQVSQECWPDVQPEDVELHRRLIQQVTAACYALHDVFFSLHVSDQMVIIAADRERRRSQASRISFQQQLSTATRRALERKMKQNENEGKPRTARGRRTWSSSCDNPSGSYGMARSCLLRQQQQQMSPPEQMVARGRYSSTSLQRRPWR